MRTPVLLLTIVLFTIPVLGASIAFHPDVPLAPAEYGPTWGTNAQVAARGSICAVTWADMRGGPTAAFVTRLRAGGSVIGAAGVRIPASRFAGTVLWTGRSFLIAY